MSLFAALLLADELHEAHANAGNGAATLDGDAGLRLEQIAVTLENLAQRLES
jgi:hypothetical protein